jgi:predicted DNA-binding transcriptional regulator YafY
MLHLVPEPRRTSLTELRRSAGHLSEPELRLLASGLDRNHPVWISYTSGDGTTTSRTIDPLELSGSVLVAYCHMRDDERHFVLKRINEVRPD